MISVMKELVNSMKGVSIVSSMPEVMLCATEFQISFYRSVYNLLPGEKVPPEGADEG